MDLIKVSQLDPLTGIKEEDTLMVIRNMSGKLVSYKTNVREVLALAKFDYPTVIDSLPPISNPQESDVVGVTRKIGDKATSSKVTVKDLLALSKFDLGKAVTDSKEIKAGEPGDLGTLKDSDVLLVVRKNVDGTSTTFKTTFDFMQSLIKRVRVLNGVIPGGAAGQSPDELTEMFYSESLKSVANPTNYSLPVGYNAWKIGITGTIGTRLLIDIKAFTDQTYMGKYVELHGAYEGETGTSTIHFANVGETRVTFSGTLMYLKDVVITYDPKKSKNYKLQYRPLIGLVLEELVKSPIATVDGVSPNASGDIVLTEYSSRGVSNSAQNLIKFNFRTPKELISIWNDNPTPGRTVDIDLRGVVPPDDWEAELNITNKTTTHTSVGFSTDKGSLFYNGTRAVVNFVDKYINMAGELTKLRITYNRGDWNVENLSIPSIGTVMGNSPDLTNNVNIMKYINGPTLTGANNSNNPANVVPSYSGMKEFTKIMGGNNGFAQIDLSTAPNSLPLGWEFLVYVGLDDQNKTGGSVMFKTIIDNIIDTNGLFTKASLLTKKYPTPSRVLIRLVHVGSGLFQLTYDAARNNIANAFPARIFNNSEIWFEPKEVGVNMYADLVVDWQPTYYRATLRLIDMGDLSLLPMDWRFRFSLKLVETGANVSRPVNILAPNSSNKFFDSQGNVLDPATFLVAYKTPVYWEAQYIHGYGFIFDRIDSGVPISYGDYDEKAATDVQDEVIMFKYINGTQTKVPSRTKLRDFLIVDNCTLVQSSRTNAKSPNIALSSQCSASFGSPNAAGELILDPTQGSDKPKIFNYFNLITADTMGETSRVIDFSRLNMSSMSYAWKMWIDVGLTNMIAGKTRDIKLRVPSGIKVYSQYMGELEQTVSTLPLLTLTDNKPHYFLFECVPNRGFMIREISNARPVGNAVGFTKGTFDVLALDEGSYSFEPGTTLSKIPNDSNYNSVQLVRVDVYRKGDLIDLTVFGSHKEPSGGLHVSKYSLMPARVGGTKTPLWSFIGPNGGSKNPVADGSWTLATL